MPAPPPPPDFPTSERREALPRTARLEKLLKPQWELQELPMAERRAEVAVALAEVSSGRP